MHYHVVVDNGRILENKKTSRDTSPVSSALESYDGKLWISWKDDGNNNLNVMDAFDTSNKTTL